MLKYKTKKKSIESLLLSLVPKIQPIEKITSVAKTPLNLFM